MEADTFLLFQGIELDIADGIENGPEDFRDLGPTLHPPVFAPRTESRHLLARFSRDRLENLQDLAVGIHRRVYRICFRLDMLQVVLFGEHASIFVDHLRLARPKAPARGSLPSGRCPEEDDP